jgi:hypothetical protein
MNRYGQLARDLSRNHRPVAYSLIPDPEQFFEIEGDKIARDVTNLRDDLLGPPRTNETLDDYRHRGYQALATAEELILADHHLFQPETAEPTEEDWEDDPELESRYRLLAEINAVIHQTT